MPVQVAWQASPPHVIFACAQACGPGPHWRSHGPVAEQVTIMFAQAWLVEASQRIWHGYVSGQTTVAM